MKFNPKLNEWAARLPGFADLHPMAPDEVAQGTLQLLWELEGALAEISGMRAVTLQPAAGAQGELTGILMIRAYHRERGDTERDEVLVPDSSHGTNPATASMAGFKTITIPSAADGGVDLDAFKAALGPRTAAVMITNPSTLGLFEARIGDLLEAVHEAGALAYMDGANLNAILGRFKPGQAGFDVMHFNVHKTFSTPHGGGGPGAGPVGVGERLAAVPADAARAAPRRRHVPPRAARRAADVDRPTAQLRRATPASSCARMPISGRTARRACARSATTRSSPRTTSSHASRAPSTCRTTGRASTSSSRRRPRLKTRTGVRTLDLAKRLIDYGFHPPTIYFPLIVEEGMLIEPTETESLETLDAFADALVEIAAEAEREPGAREGGPAHRAGQAPRRGDRRTPAESALAADGRRADALPRLIRERDVRAMLTGPTFV